MIFASQHESIYYWHKGDFQKPKIVGRLGPKMGLRMVIDRKNNQVEFFYLLYPSQEGEILGTYKWDKFEDNNTK